MQYFATKRYSINKLEAYIAKFILTKPAIKSCAHVQLAVLFTIFAVFAVSLHQKNRSKFRDLPKGTQGWRLAPGMQARAKGSS
jgi:hypothetical protein